jgi:hypothetical protein
MRFPQCLQRFRQYLQRGRQTQRPKKFRRPLILEALEERLVPSNNADLFVSSLAFQQGSSVQQYNRMGAFIANFEPSHYGGLLGPDGMAFGPDGNLYVGSGQQPGSVKRYDGSNGVFLGDFVPPGSGGLIHPQPLRFGPDGNLYVGDNDGTVKLYDGMTGAFIKDFVPSHTGGLGQTEGLAFGPGGDLYVADGNVASVKHYRKDGLFLGNFVSSDPMQNGGLGTAENLVFGPANATSFYARDLYVSDELNNSVKRYNGATGAYMGDFVTSGSGGLHAPEALVFGPDNNLYVISEQGNGVVKLYSGTTGGFIKDFVPQGMGLFLPTELAFHTPGYQPFFVSVEGHNLGLIGGDTVTLSPNTLTFELAAGEPNAADIQLGIFHVGDSGSLDETFTFELSRLVTIDGVTMTISQRGELSVTPVCDTLSLFDGATTTFDLGSYGLLDFTPKGLVQSSTEPGDFPLTLRGDVIVASGHGLSATSSFLVSGLPAQVQAGTTGTLTVVAKDQYGNTATDYRGTVHFTSSDRQADLPADYTFVAADNGQHTFPVIVKAAGTQSLMATDTVDASITGFQEGIVVSPAAAVSLGVTAPSTVLAGTPLVITVFALDPFGNIDTNYTGTVTFQSSDAAATLPNDYTFGASDSGQADFSVILRTGGNQTLTVRDRMGNGGNVPVGVFTATHFQVTPVVSIVQAGKGHSSEGKLLHAKASAIRRNSLR